jgi:hypothetical protein
MGGCTYFAPSSTGLVVARVLVGVKADVPFSLPFPSDAQPTGSSNKIKHSVNSKIFFIVFSPFLVIIYITTAVKSTFTTHNRRGERLSSKRVLQAKHRVHPNLYRAKEALSTQIVRKIPHPSANRRHLPQGEGFLLVCVWIKIYCFACHLKIN